jgi:undecaprenyl-diphosphatase
LGSSSAKKDDDDVALVRSLTGEAESPDTQWPGLTKPTAPSWTPRAGVLLVAWAGLTGILLAAGFGVIHSSTVAAFDRHVTSTVVAHRTFALNTLMRAVTWLGSWVALVATGVLVVVLAVRGRLRWLGVLLAVAAWAGEAGAVTLAKHVVQRQRPPQDIRLVSAHGWSWPSGHTATAVLVFSVLALVLTPMVRSRATRVAIWGAATVAMAAVGFSRIELGVHWTTDAVASIVFVSGWLVVIVALFARELRSAGAPLHRDRVSPP